MKVPSFFYFLLIYLDYLINSNRSVNINDLFCEYRWENFPILIPNFPQIGGDNSTDSLRSVNISDFFCDYLWDILSRNTRY